MRLGPGRTNCLEALLVLLVLGCARTPGHADRVQVVTTLGVLADWVRNVGAERVRVTSLLTGLEDPHNYELKPRDIALIARADLLLRVGLGLDDWLTGAIENSGNRRLLILEAADETAVIEDPDDPRPEADSQRRHHAAGNPHVWLDPANAKISIAHLAAALVRIDPGGESLYRANAQRYCHSLDSLTQAIQHRVAMLSDRRLISFHDAWPYFARRFGFEIVAAIEPVPGREPSARQLTRLTDLIRREHIKVISAEPQLPSEVPGALARETGARVVVMTPLTGTLPGIEDYLSLLDFNANILIEPLQ